jgi:hypothetical protein
MRMLYVLAYLLKLAMLINIHTTHSLFKPLKVNSGTTTILGTHSDNEI